MSGIIVHEWISKTGGSEKVLDAMVETLQNFVKATVAPYKYPRSVVFCTELPRTPTGKLQRFRLREGATAPI